MMNKKFRLIGLTALVAMPLVSIQPVNAEMFKCVSLKGDIFYNDKPCPVKDKETLIKADKAPKNGYIPPAFVGEKNEKSDGISVGGDSVSQKIMVKEKEKNEKQQVVNTDNNGGATTANGKATVAGDQASNSSTEKGSSANKDIGGNPASVTSRNIQAEKSSNKGLATIPLQVERRKELIDR